MRSLASSSNGPKAYISASCNDIGPFRKILERFSCCLNTPTGNAPILYYTASGNHGQRARRRGKMSPHNHREEDVRRFESETLIHQASLYQSARSLLGSPSEAEDV